MIDLLFVSSSLWLSALVKLVSATFVEDEALNKIDYINFRLILLVILDILITNNLTPFIRKLQHVPFDMLLR